MERTGVVFNYKQKVLLVEKFTNVQFVLPYPLYNASIDKYLINIAKILDSYWQTPSGLCQLDYTHTNETNFTINWVYRVTLTEHELALQDLATLVLDSRTLLKNDQTGGPGRTRRGLPLAVGLGAGVLGLGLGIGGQPSCGLSGILGGCRKISEENKAAISATVSHINAMNLQWSRVQVATDEKFFVLGEELMKLREVQQNIMEAQNENFETLQGQVEVLKQNVHILRNCNQFLYTRGQVNHHVSIVTGVLNTLQSLIRTYRTSLSIFRMNLMQNLASMSNGYIPISILNRKLLKEILHTVITQETEKDSRKTLSSGWPRDLLIVSEKLR